MRTCPRCDNPCCNDSDYYCFNCGMPLQNHCRDENCYYNSEDELPPEACYCPQCGSETTYLIEKFISPASFE